MLCIPKQTVETVHAEICGILFEIVNTIRSTFTVFTEQVVKEAIAGGVELYDSEVKKSVRKAAYGLHLTKEAALTIACKEVISVLVSDISVQVISSGYVLIDLSTSTKKGEISQDDWNGVKASSQVKEFKGELLKKSHIPERLHGVNSSQHPQPIAILERRIKKKKKAAASVAGSLGE
ncbi:unnamed protein product [Cuscuta campestris]|uniref:Uncharacterized protein n=1 Tax=Cuscuta campestris TaxID=132261 RepID=A0A484NH15_9ASTE|nr:unnamed protein product [Cuscuta campestris]